jgi:hypothetical protein
MQLPYTDTVPINKTWQPKENLETEEENIALARLYVLADKLLDTITQNVIVATLLAECREWQHCSSHGIRVWRPSRSFMKACLAPAPLVPHGRLLVDRPCCSKWLDEISLEISQEDFLDVALGPITKNIVDSCEAEK